MQSDKQGATKLMENQDGIERRPLLETRGRAVAQGVELAVACLISYALITQLSLARTRYPEKTFLAGCGPLSQRLLCIAKATRRA
jgi:hypothetical protein